MLYQLTRKVKGFNEENMKNAFVLEPSALGSVVNLTKRSAGT
jgi:hypothetical protein